MNNRSFTSRISFSSGLIALLLVLSAPLSAGAQTITLQPGQSYCASLSVSTYFAVSASSDKHVQFSVVDDLSAPPFGSYVLVSNHGFGVAGSWYNSYPTSYLFPGVFTFCARRGDGQATPAVVEITDLEGS